MSYRVKTVCGMVGIPRPTLLAWERRYDILEPRRSDSGHRIYTDEDVDVLRRLKRLVDEGYAIGEAVRLQRSRPTSQAEASTPLHERLLSALLAYDRAGADRLTPDLHQYTFAQAVDQVYLPMLRETGERWADGRISIAQEHYVSGWCREQLFAIFHGLGSGPAAGPAAVCALAPGEAHEMGLLAIAIHLMLAGWRITWLGADLPVEDLCRYVATERPRLVCLSTMSGAEPVTVAGWARRLREAAPKGTLVAVGGRCAKSVVVSGVIFCETVDDLLNALHDERGP